MDLKIDPGWLLYMAEKEGNGILSVGGLVTRMSFRCAKCRDHSWCPKCSGEGCSPYGVLANGPCWTDHCPECGKANQ